MSDQFTAETLEGFRLSNHFMLLDFLFDAHSSYSSTTSVSDLSSVMSYMRMTEARFLAETLMEDLTAKFGPCSIAAGYAPDADTSPHSFTHGKGAAVDAVFHNWVRPSEGNVEGTAPALMLPQVHQDQIAFDRLIAYAGTEFMCIATRSRGNSFRVYENVRTAARYDHDAGSQGLAKPLFLTHSRNPSEWKRFEGIRNSRSGWRREEGEPVFHTRRSIRPQHIRTGQFFTLMDFIRNPVAIVNRIRNIPPVAPCKQIKVARMFSEVLDNVVAEVGRLSILRGLEGVSAAKAADAHYADGTEGLHRWTKDTHRVRFVAPFGHSENTVTKALASHPGVDEVYVHRTYQGEPIYNAVIHSFDPARLWTSTVTHGVSCPCCT